LHKHTIVDEHSLRSVLDKFYSLQVGVIDQIKFVEDLEKEMELISERDEIMSQFADCLLEKDLTFNYCFQKLLAIKNIDDAEIDAN
jgi:hypothetical protein